MSMHITFAPVRRDDILTLERRGDALIVNGEVFDFAALAEGGELPLDAIDSDWFAGPVLRRQGILHVTLVLPHGVVAPDATLFPVPVFQVSDGAVALPPHTQIEEVGIHAED
jgi:hypothetical protein